MKSILDEQKYNEEKGYYVSEERIYLINEDRFIQTFDLNNIFNIDYAKLKMQIINNPIDKYESTLETSTTLDMVSSNVEITNLWFEEIDYSLSQLKEILSEEEYNELIKTQKSWKDYIDSEYSYYTSKYYDGFQRIALINEYKNKVRQRAIDLIVYLCAVSRYDMTEIELSKMEDINIDFYYNKEKN